MKQAIESIKETIKLEDLCREYGMDLKQSGSVYKCLCPFFFNDTATTEIYTNDNHYHCFGCNEHGDVIEFVKKNEGISFMGALRKLCKRGGIPMPKEIDEKKYEQQKKTERILELAALYYHISLNSDPCPGRSSARRYLNKRGIVTPSIGFFMIGYAPSKDSLIPLLMNEHGFSSEEIVKAGLAYKDCIGNICPVFTNRIMFPFLRNWKPFYLTGRTLDEDEPKKYLNLSTSNEFINKDLYHLAALNLQSDEIYVTEGIFDCILAVQEGLPAIATCGTSMKDYQVKRLKDKNVFIVFDNDKNGQGKKCAVSLGTLMLEHEINPKIIELPRGRRKSKVDLADYIKEEGNEGFIELKEKSLNIIDYKIREGANKSKDDLNNYIREELFPLLVKLDNLDSASWLEKLGEKYGFKTEPKKALMSEFKEAQRRYRKAIHEKETEKRIAYEMTQEEKEEALEYLKDPNLSQRIQTDLKTVGIVGEEINALSLYLFSVTRKTKEPISAVLFGDSSTGKSYLLNTISSLCPEEDRLIITSASSRAFEYGTEEQLKNKFIVIQEIQGMKDVEATIRVMQSEGKLARYVTQKEFDGGPHISNAREVECPASIITTTTHDSVHPENSTRVFELYLDQSSEQTKRILQFQKEKAAGWWIEREEEIEFSRRSFKIQKGQ
jgi:DNA primase catalytic core